jgi:hypothetical protein
MIIPRFTIKILLIVTAIAAVFALIMREAVREQPWAIALCTTLGSIVFVFFLFVLFWTIAWLWDQTVGQAMQPPPPAGGNPFASAGLPRQVVPPTGDPQ